VDDEGKSARILGACNVPSSNEEEDTSHATEYDNGHDFGNGSCQPRMVPKLIRCQVLNYDGLARGLARLV